MTSAFGPAEAKALVPGFVRSANRVSFLSCVVSKLIHGFHSW